MIQQENKPKYRTNTFYYYAQKYRQHLIEEDKLQATDWTPLYRKEQEQIIKKGELWNQTINGRVRTGKSTVGMMEGKHIAQHINTHHRTQKNQKITFGMENIARDDQEYSEKMKNPKLFQTVIVTDESNELEHGGENVTIEKQLQSVWSNIHAGRYVHKIWCCPNDVVDDNSDIILEVVAIDPNTKTTHCNLYYRLLRGGQKETPQLLGHVNINVAPLIKNWEKHVKKIFLKPTKNTKDQKKISYWQKKDFYVNYMVKKYEKMELLTQHGVFRPRLMKLSTLLLNVINETKTLTKRKRGINYEFIEVQIDKWSRILQIPLTIPGRRLAGDKAYGIIKMYKSYYQICQEINQAKRKEPHKITELTHEKKVYVDAIKSSIQELETIKKINEEYQK